MRRCSFKSEMQPPSRGLVPSDVLLELFRRRLLLSLLLRWLLQLFLPEIICLVDINVWEYQVKNFAVPVDSMTFNIILDILYTEASVGPWSMNNSNNSSSNKNTKGLHTHLRQFAPISPIFLGKYYLCCPGPSCCDRLLP